MTDTWVWYRWFGPLQCHQCGYTPRGPLKHWLMRRHVRRAHR